MDASADVIERFYRSFSRRDHAGMGGCYDPAVEFTDPVFGDLSGRRVVAMWHMLCEQGSDLEIEFERTGDDTVRWVASYTFSPTGRRVRNVIDATFTVRSDRIVRHIDRFSLWSWTRMALGPVGWVAGWTPPVRSRLRSTATKSLDRFITEHPEYATDA